VLPSSQRLMVVVFVTLNRLLMVILLIEQEFE